MLHITHVASLTVALCWSSLAWGAPPAAGCEAPDPPPPVPYGWLPTCLLVRADAPQAESVIANEAAHLLQAPPPAASGPFDLYQVHPLGFSPEGRFAWLRLGGGDEGSPTWGLFIVDLRTDEVLERYFGPTEPDRLPVWDLASVIRAHRQEFESRLGRHRIRVEPLTVAPAPFQRNQRTYTVRIVEERGDHAVWFEEAALGHKRLGPLETWSPCAMCGEPRFRVVVSPFEPRAAVIVAHRTSRLHSAIPGVTHAVLGAHLTEGFAKPE